MELQPIGNLGGGLPALMGTGTPPKPAGKGKALEDACDDFVGVLFGYVCSQMRPQEEAEDGTLFSGENSQMFMGLLDQEVGKQMARKEGSGLSKQLYWQMSQGPGQGKKG